MPSKPDGPRARRKASTRVASTAVPDRVERIRRFNRFYTKQIGVLREGLLDSDFSLTEARVLFEIAHHERVTATELSEELSLDEGYLSRILHTFARRGLIERGRSQADGRQRPVSLTEAGNVAFADLNARSRHQLEAMLMSLGAGQQDRLVKSMEAIQTLLGETAGQPRAFILRRHQPGDIGWVIYRHGVLYYREYGWDEAFEALVARILGEFVTNLDHDHERSWIAEADGQFAGCVFVTKESKTVARLRCLLVEPAMRGLGLGSRLVEECVRFSCNRGYRRLTLWTNDVLLEARRIYERAGFRLSREAPHHSFGHDLVGQTWNLRLT